MKKKIILITGSSGFIGNFFLSSALQKGFCVIDILRKKNKKNKQLNFLRKKFKKNYKSLFFSNLNQIEKLLKNKKIDYFVNFATLYKNNHKHKEILEFIESNISFPNIIVDCLGHKVKKIINFGTMMQHTDGKNYFPKNYYASTKSAFEMILNFYASQNQKLKFYNLKFYESYAEIDNRNKLIPTLYRNFKKEIKTDIISKNLELNIVHVNDIIKSIYLLLNDNSIKSGSYCLKQKQNIKIKKLISNINAHSKKKLKIRYLNHKIKIPNKISLKPLPKWKPKSNIQKVIEKNFFYENN